LRSTKQCQVCGHPEQPQQENKMNTPYNTGKVQIGKYYQKPLRIEQDDDMIELQGYLLGKSKTARMERIAKRIYFGMVVFCVILMMFL